MENSKRPIFVKSDIDAAIGVFFDGFIKVITGIGVLVGIGMARETVFGQILPGIGLGVFLLHIFLWYMGIRQQKIQNNPNITAIPGGIGAGHFFMFIFLIIIPTYNLTGDAMLALSVGVAANIVISAMLALLAFIGPWLLKIIPGPALMGSLGGGALAWLVMAVIIDMFGNPIIALISFFIVFYIFTTKIKLKVSPLVISVIFGIIITLITGHQAYLNHIMESFKDLSFNLPLPHLGIVFGGFHEVIKFIPILFVNALAVTIGNMQGIAQATVYGDEYDIKAMQFGSSLISILSALFCNPFNVCLWWGYTGWRESKTTPSYSLLVGITYLLIGVTGLASLITSIIPIASAIPILLFIGLSTCGATFANEKKKYYTIMVIGLTLPVIEFVQGKMASESVPLGVGILSAGAMMTAIVWISILYFAVERRYKESAISALVGAILSFVGLIHNSNFLIAKLIEGGFTDFSEWQNSTYGYMTIAYLIVAFLIIMISRTKLSYEEDIIEN